MAGNSGTMKALMTMRPHMATEWFPFGRTQCKKPNKLEAYASTLY
jgi:hypothetical protein